MLCWTQIVIFTRFLVINFVHQHLPKDFEQGTLQNVACKKRRYAGLWNRFKVASRQSYRQLWYFLANAFNSRNISMLFHSYEWASCSYITLYVLCESGSHCMKIMTLLPTITHQAVC